MDKSFLVFLLSFQVILSGQQSRMLCRSCMPQEGYLRCKTGVVVTIYPDGRVNGTRGDYNKFAILRTTTFLSNKYIAIFGVQAKKYLCMTRKGKIYGSDVYNLDDCVFLINELSNHYTTFSREGPRKLCIGFTKTGKSRKGRVKHRRSRFIWIQKKSQRTKRNFCNTPRRHCRKRNIFLRNERNH